MDYANKQKPVTKYLVSLAKQLTYNNKILVCAHTHETLTMLSLTAGNVSSALCSTNLATLIARQCRIFSNLETCISHDKNFVGFPVFRLQESQ
jgi:hypothetical protein